MSKKKSVRYRATEAADTAFAKARAESGGRFGEDGPIAIVVACRAYDATVMRAMRREAERRGSVFVDFLKEVNKELGSSPPTESVW